jgi:signal transduction histidine kinase
MNEKLRDKALEILSRKDTKLSERFAEEDLDVILQELDVYEVELHAQNIELQQQGRDLERSMAEFETLFLDAPVSYIIIDSDYRVLKANRMAEASFHFMSYRLGEKKFVSALVEGSLSKFYTWILSEKLFVEPLTVKMHLPDDNAHRHFKLFARQYPRDTDKILLSVVDIQHEYDLAEEVKIKEQALVDQAKMAAKGELLSMIAHQWRQPLAAIGTMISKARIDMELDGPDQQALTAVFDDMDATVHHLSETISKFMQLHDNRVCVDTIEIDALLPALMKVVSDDTGIVEIHAKKSLVWHSDRELLLQVLATLLNNALEAVKSEAMQHSPHIDLTVQQFDGHIRFTVIDNGGGIALKDLPHVTEPYYSTKSLNTRGLGLYIARIITEQALRGTLKIENFENGVKAELEIPEL